MSRQKANLELLNNLIEIIVRYPDLRFGQMLAVFGFVQGDFNNIGAPLWVNEFYTESKDILDRVKETRELIHPGDKREET